MNMELHQSQKQTLAMTPQMEQAIKILEMDAQMLDDYLLGLSLENPIVCLDGEHYNIEEATELHELAEIYTYGSGISGQPPENRRQPPIDTLQAYLLEQVMLDCPKELLPSTMYVIGHIDETGYLVASAQDMAAWGGFSHDTIERAVDYVKHLEPPGIGARNLHECLLLQLPEEDALARRIVSLHLDDIAKARYGQLTKLLNVSSSELTDAILRIKRLNPKPGSGFGSIHTLPYITPDVMVVCADGTCNVRLCTPGRHIINLNQSYVSLMRKTDDEAVKAYVAGKMKQLEWVQKCIADRSWTLLNVTKAIVSHQERFFIDGPRHMGVLGMADIAGMVDMHISTISRAVKNKHLICTHGTFPLKHFFVQGVKSTGADNASAHHIKHRMQELIAHENKSAPLSDRQIALKLEQQGIHLSRRTVVKYREQMKLPSSQYRRSGMPQV